MSISTYNFINLGLSGNGKMEKEVAGMLANIDADAFILDCIPNPSPKEITERAVGFVMTLREKLPNNCGHVVTCSYSVNVTLILSKLIKQVFFRKLRPIAFFRPKIFGNSKSRAIGLGSIIFRRTSDDNTYQ